MDTTKKPFKLPPAFVTTGHNETQRVERLDDGRTRVTVYKCGKEVRSYIEDRCNPKPWWKFWDDPRQVAPVANQRVEKL